MLAKQVFQNVSRNNSILLQAFGQVLAHDQAGKMQKNLLIQGAQFVRTGNYGFYCFNSVVSEFIEVTRKGFLKFQAMRLIGDDLVSAWNCLFKPQIHFLIVKASAACDKYEQQAVSR